jgi:hypothetical protein
MIFLIVDDHETVADPHFVGMRAGGHLKRCQNLWILRIAHIDHGRAAGGAHVSDICDPVLNNHLPAARTINVTGLS